MDKNHFNRFSAVIISRFEEIPEPRIYVKREGFETYIPVWRTCLGILNQNFIDLKISLSSLMGYALADITYDFLNKNASIINMAKEDLAQGNLWMF